MSTNRPAAANAAFGVALALALAAVVTPATAAPTPRAFEVSFGQLVPGETRSAEFAFGVSVASTLAISDWVQDSASGAFVWDARLCGLDCRPVSAHTVRQLDPGDYRLVVAVTLAADAPPSATGRLAGRLSLTQTDPQGLAATGFAGAALTVAAGPLVALGLVLVLIAGRRRSADEGEPA